MSSVVVGDTVARRSYSCDIPFLVVRIYDRGPARGTALLRGVRVRLMADAPLDDLVRVGKPSAVTAKETAEAQWVPAAARALDCRTSALAQAWLGTGMRGGGSGSPGAEPCPEIYHHVPGKVLHVDGDRDYLGDCLAHYAKLGVPAAGEYVPEKEQPNRIASLLTKHVPEILILTGHDGLIKRKGEKDKVASYRTSAYFVEAVRAARRVRPNRDSLAIFAGACQSFYELLIDAGANFASSPERVLIHCFDPILVAEKLSYSPVDRVVPAREVIEATVTGVKGVGGVATRGRFRLGLPGPRVRLQSEVSAGSGALGDAV